MFQALGGRYDSFGGTLSLAAVAGAVGGLVLGRLIDTGRARAALWLNAAAAGLVLRCVTFGHAAAVVAIAVGTTMLSGLYLPHGCLQRSKKFPVRAALSVRRRGRLGRGRCARRRHGGGDLLLRTAGRGGDPAGDADGFGAGAAARPLLCDAIPRGAGDVVRRRFRHSRVGSLPIRCKQIRRIRLQHDVAAPPRRVVDQAPLIAGRPCRLRPGRHRAG